MKYAQFHSKWLGLAIAVLLLLAMVIGCSPAANPLPPPVTSGTTALAGMPTLADIANKVLPSVVYILVNTSELDFFGQPAQTAGSGIIFSSDGYILTNKHVVEDAVTVEVTLYDRRNYQVPLEKIWRDDVVDLAVIRIDEKSLPALHFADPDSVTVGDWVMAVGNALGFAPTEGGATVTDGIVSNLGRSFSLNDTPYYDLIQTSAAINTGNSGGPLVNMAGEVVGINSVGATDAQNIAFAIGSGVAEHVFSDLIKYGKSVHPFLGATLQDITPEVVQKMKTPRAGALIADLEPQSPADQAGIQVNDTIVEFDGKPVKLAADLVKLVWRHEPGDEVNVVYVHNGKQVKASITLGQRAQGSAI